MKRNEYEKRKRALDEQLRVALDLVHAGHRAQVQMLEILWRTSSEAEEGSEAPSLPDSTGAAPSPSPKRRRPAGELYEDVVAAFPQLPEDFTKNDVIRCLGYSPDRASLFRVLDALQLEGRIELKTRGWSQTPAVYRKKHDIAP